MKYWKALFFAFMGLLVVTVPAKAGEKLYNGIKLPDQWPPDKDKLSREVMEVPYLKTPPAVIFIDVGRQLFVDDFLIQETGLSRKFHRPKSYPGNPVLRADKEWEAYTIPFSGGAWYDPKDKRFKLWYSCHDGELEGREFGFYPLSLATSTDGINWNKPNLGKGNNIVLKAHHDSSVVWLDQVTKNPKERFKYFATEYFGVRDGDNVWALTYRISPDGIHWSAPLAQKEVWGDRITAFYNPFRKVWVISHRMEGKQVGRCRGYLEAPTPMELMKEVKRNPFMKAEGKSVLWTGADKYDPRHPWVENDTPAEMYALDATPYESLMLGFFSIYQGDPGHKNFVLTGFSRDGFHWWRPDRRPFLYDERGDGWILKHKKTSDQPEVRHVVNDIQSVGGGCLVVGDKLYFYAKSWPADAGEGFVNLYVLRRDGFASMEAGEETELLTTRPVTFRGKHLFVNVDCPKGELRVDVLDKNGKIIGPFSSDDCEPISCNKTLVRVNWEQNKDLAALAGKPVRFRFHLRNGSLYSFWVSPDKSGASHGYVGAGGPGFTGPTDGSD